MKQVPRGQPTGKPAIPEPAMRLYRAANTHYTRCGCHIQSECCMALAAALNAFETDMGLRLATQP